MSTRIVRGLSAGVVGLATSVASAGLSNVPIYTITASNSGGVADAWSTSVTGANLPFDTTGNASWTPTWASQASPGGVFTCLNDNAASGRRMSASFSADPVINIFFSIQNNTAGTLEFTVNVPVLSFAPDLYSLTNASAQIGVTDTNGDGAAIVGSFTGARVAEWSLLNSGSPLLTGQLTTGPVVGPFASGNLSQNDNSGSTSYLIDSQSISFKFTLTPGDIATGSGVVVTTLVPAPGSIALMGIGGLVALRRRR